MLLAIHTEEEMLSHRWSLYTSVLSSFIVFHNIAVAVAATAYFVVSCAALRFEMLFVSSSASRRWPTSSL